MKALVAVLAVSLGLGGAAAVPAAQSSPGWQDADRLRADLEREIRKLEKRFGALAAEGRACLERERRIARRKLAELRARSQQAWRRVRPELEKRLEELRKVFEDPSPPPEFTRT